MDASKQGETMGDRSFVSVVVPVYNDAAGVETTLESLVEQTYPGTRYEVLAVDNGSTDDTATVIRSFAERSDVVRYLEETEMQGSYAARNAGIESARGEVFAFVDADMTVPPDWVETCAQQVHTSRPYLAFDVELYFAGRRSLVGAYNRRTGFPVERYVRNQRYAPTCALAVHRSVVDAVGDFDSRLVSGGDSEFGNRVAAAGYPLSFTDAATLRHPVRNSLPSLLKKEWRVGRGLCQRQIYYPARYGRPGIPPAPSGATVATGTRRDARPADDAETSDEETSGHDDHRRSESLPTRLSFAGLDLLTTGVRAGGYFFEAGTYYLESMRSLYV